MAKRTSILARMRPTLTTLAAGAATDAQGALTRQERLVKAGVLSGRFWLQAIIGNGQLS